MSQKNFKKLLHKSLFPYIPGQNQAFRSPFFLNILLQLIQPAVQIARYGQHPVTVPGKGKSCSLANTMGRSGNHDVCLLYTSRCV